MLDTETECDDALRVSTVALAAWVVLRVKETSWESVGVMLFE